MIGRSGTEPVTMRTGVLGVLLALVAGQAWAEVTVTFYAHPGARVRAG